MSYPLKIVTTLSILFILTNCGGDVNAEKTAVKGTTTTLLTDSNGTTDSSPTEQTNTNNGSDIDENEFNRAEYKGLIFYPSKLEPAQYKLTQLGDNEFNTLNEIEKLQVANKLLSTLFFAYSEKELKERIDSNTFISHIREKLQQNQQDISSLEESLLDKDKFGNFGAWANPQAIKILSRFYLMKKLDKYYYNNWLAYTLTQTIMFSPAYELDTSYNPNISRVYNRLVNMLQVDSGMRYISYVHMMSEDNWRRFRSPEDNGREMLEIFTLDNNDSHVPLAAKALKNWKLNRESNTLEVGLDKNKEAIKLFNTTIYNGDDFYRELTKSKRFTISVTTRLVNYFFDNTTSSKKEEIINKIVSSKPEKWEDIIEQIIFSKTYLLYSSKVKSAEESFYSFSKKTAFKHYKHTFYHLKSYLNKMNQATMKYKLGKLQRVPLDTLSFAYYHKYIREELLFRLYNPKYEKDYSSWSRQGWDRDFISIEKFNPNSKDDVKSLKSFINYLFKAFIYREATEDEFSMFKEHIIESRDGKELFKNEFNIFKIRSDGDSEKEAQEQLNRRINIATLTLEYLSKLDEFYILKAIK